MKMNCQIILFNILLGVLISTLGSVSAQAPCRTPDNTVGRCVPFRECRSVQKMYEIWGSNLPKIFSDSLMRSRCKGNAAGIHICCDNSYISSPMIRTTKTTTTTTTARPQFKSLSSSDYASSLSTKGVKILSSHKCGALSGDRVAFGEKTGLAEFPWMALLRYDSDDEQFKCGGSLITNRYVLTAAHCHVDVDDNLIGVRLGEHDLDSVRDCERRGPKWVCSPPVEDYGIEKIIAHPKYSRDYYINDVALIKLDRPVIFKKHISPICLPITQRSTQLPADGKYLIAGWGTTEKGSSSKGGRSKVLLKARVPHKDRQVCQDIYKRTAITKNHICAGGDVRADSCKGDSGGPLFFVGPYQRTARYVQFGIVSFGGIECGSERNNPGLYASVIDLMPWITNNID